MNVKSIQIDLASEFGDHLSTREIWGIKVQNKIVECLELGYNITISFKGMKVVSHSFLDEAFAKLVEQYELDFLKERLSFIDISDYHRANLNNAILHRQKIRQIKS